MLNKYQEAIAAICQNDINHFKQLIQDYPNLANFRPPPDSLGNQNTLLHELTGMGRKDVKGVGYAFQMAQILIDNGADIDAPEKETGGETPLIHAVSVNNAPVTEVLLKNGANPEKTGRYDGSLDTALGYALFYGQDERLATYQVNCPILLVKSGAEIKLPFATALHENDLAISQLRLSDQTTQMQAFFFACKYGNLKMANKLLELGLDINAKMPFFHYNLTALHLTCEHHNQVKMVEFLLKNGADTTIQDGAYQATAIDWAKHCGQYEVVNLFASKDLIS